MCLITFSYFFISIRLTLIREQKRKKYKKYINKIIINLKFKGVTLRLKLLTSQYQ